MYKSLKLDLTPDQVKKSIQGKTIKITNKQIDNGENTVLLHPTNYRILIKAKNSGKGANIILSAGEIEATRQSDLEGTGIFDWLKKGWNWAKNNWDSTLKPIASAVADVGVPALASALGAPQLAGVARSGLKDLTGVGAQPKTKLVKGSDETKAYMANLRAKRKGKKKPSTAGSGLYI